MAESALYKTAAAWQADFPNRARISCFFEFLCANDSVREGEDNKIDHVNCSGRMDRR